MSSLFSILGGFGRLQGAMHEARATAQSSEALERASDAARTSRELMDRLDRLTLVCMALWALLREKAGLSEQELLDKVRQIDLADGREDGKFRPQRAECPRCGRVMSSRHKRCLYCGSENLKHSPFDAAK